MAKQKINQTQYGIKYSTDEQLTGDVWVDGKPIYRKTIILNVVSGAGANTAHGITGMTRIIKWENSFYRSDIGVTFNYLTLPSVESFSPIYQIGVSASNTNIFIAATNMPYNGTAYVTINYIK